MGILEDLDLLERQLRQLQIEWDKFFGGAERKPPTDLRTKVEALIRSYAYTEIRRSATDDGFVQQHVLVATNRAGQRVEVPACIVVRIADGHITRLDEYIDSANVAQIMAT